MRFIYVHPKVKKDIKLCIKKKWYQGIGKDAFRLCKYLEERGLLPAETTVRRLPVELQDKTLHSRISLKDENTGKRKGGRMVYIKENTEVFKIIYIGGHKDKRYDNEFQRVKLIKERYQYDTGEYISYKQYFRRHLEI